MNAPHNLTRNFANPRAIRPAPDPVPPGARPEIFLQDVGDVPEERWVQQAENVAFLPLTFGVTQGYYVNLLRVRKSGVLSCHRHFGAVHAHVMKGRWFYLEHDWVATEGSFVMEAPGETHTLVVPDDVPVVDLEAGDKSLLQPGAHLVAFGPKSADGSIDAKRIIVGEKGAVPPM